MTYAELDKLSSQLARHLVGLGVGPEVMVPLCFSKSIWAIVAMVAVMKAGGAFVSLNPSHPISHLSAIIQEVQAIVILVAPSTSGQLNGVSNYLEIRPSLFDNLSSTSRFSNAAVTPSNAAFAIFTSGSTGKPKGIIQEHRAFCAALRDYGSVMKIGIGSRILQFAAYTFDVSNNDILGTLTHGGCLCVPSKEDRISNLANFINVMDVNVACLTPTVVGLLPGRRA